MNEELRAASGRVSRARWRALHRSDHFGDTVGQTRLAERMGGEQPTLGRLLHGFERDGLIEWHPCEPDPRARVIRLNPQVRSVLRKTRTSPTLSASASSEAPLVPIR